MATHKKRRGKRDEAQKKEASALNGDMEERLLRAQAVMETNWRGTVIIHDQWRRILKILSFVVFAISVHQSLKAYEENEMTWDDLAALEANEAVNLAVQKSTLPLFGVATFMSFFVCSFLQFDGPSFSSPLFMVSCACLPALFLMMRQQSVSSHKFPVAVVFHPVVTVSCFFMGYQTRRHRSNIEKVVEMRRKVKKQMEERTNGSSNVKSK